MTIMKFQLNTYNRNVTDEDLISDLKSVAGRLGLEAMSMETYTEHGRFNGSTLQKRFGSWEAALQRAELNPVRQTNITDEDLFENIENLWITLGRQPKYAEVCRPKSKFSAKPYETRFGGWRNALEAFVAFIDSESKEESPVQNYPDVETRKARSRTVNLRLRFAVMRRDNFRCCACGRSPATHPGLELQIDHIKPYSRGGDTAENNLQTLCFDCNQGKSDTVENDT